MQEKIRLGTRGSPLAIVQARMAAAAIAKAKGWPDSEANARIDIVVVKTSGDKITDRPLADIGGKGLFAKELEEALDDRRIDIAVHSAKDLPSFLPVGLCIAGALPRSDPRDALISPVAGSIAELPHGAVVGTSSVRRQAQILALRPDLKIVMFRGNVDTRLAKLKAGEVDATLLAAAGLLRLNRLDEVTAILDPKAFIPAAAQGIIAFETREDDAVARTFCAEVTDPLAMLALTIERAFLGVLDGSCKTPLAAHAEIAATGAVAFHGAAFAPDGSRRFDLAREVQMPNLEQGARLGAEAGEDILRRAGRAFFQV